MLCLWSPATAEQLYEVDTVGWFIFAVLNHSELTNWFYFTGLAELSEVENASMFLVKSLLQLSEIHAINTMMSFGKPNNIEFPSSTMTLSKVNENQD